MRFRKAKEALLFWWGYLQDGGVPLHPQANNPHAERVQDSLTAWQPDDVLCAYVTVSKVLDRLSESDKTIIKSWLMDVVGTHDEMGRRTYNSWRYRSKFGGACLRLWNLLPKEYKHGRGSSPHSQRGSLPTKHKRSHPIQDASVRQTKRIQGWIGSQSPMASVGVCP